jgi:hypothetical protein
MYNDEVSALARPYGAAEALAAQLGREVLDSRSGMDNVTVLSAGLKDTAQY